MNRSSVFLPRRLARLAVRVAILPAVVLAVLVAGTGTASAHVSVSSPDAARGGFGLITFRVPNESDSASTVRVRIQLPQGTPFASVSLQPVPGWTATTTRAELDPPVGVHGEEITSAVSVVDFAADAGRGIAPGEFQLFSLSGGPFPDVESLTFNVVQTYSDGTESAWIEPSVEGQAEPEFPAPVLLLSADAGEQTTAPARASAPADHGHGSGTDPGAVALYLSIVALLAGIGGCVLGWRAYRRTVSP
jgi:uncharacterized protein YcnI